MKTKTQLLKRAMTVIARKRRVIETLLSQVASLESELTDCRKRATDLKTRLNRASIPVSAIYGVGKSQPVLLRELLKIVRSDKRDGKIVDGVLISPKDMLPVVQNFEVAECMMLDGVKVLRSSAIREGFGLVVSRFRLPPNTVMLDRFSAGKIN